MSMGVCCLLVQMPSGSRAGDYHRGSDGSLRCSDCHTAHYSQGGSVPSDWGQDGAYRLLLKKEMINDLCLMCHDGTDGEAPNVKNPADYISSAGAFNPTGTPDESNRHSLGSTSAPPGFQGTWEAVPLTCTSCHDPHGNQYYRNLKPNPGQASSITITYMTGSTYDDNSAIQMVAAIPLSTRYSTANIRYRQTLKAPGNYGLSAWCAGCHGQFHGAGGAANMGGSVDGDTGSSPWLRHPTQDVTMGEGNTNGHVSLLHWSSSLNSRTPVVSPNSTLGDDDDQVFCGSCHKAHGSTHRNNLLWDNEQTEANEDGTKLLNTCQQCHYK